jgi:hypothetical protein
MVSILSDRFKINVMIKVVDSLKEAEWKEYTLPTKSSNTLKNLASEPDTGYM